MRQAADKLKSLPRSIIAILLLVILVAASILLALAFRYDGAVTLRLLQRLQPFIYTQLLASIGCLMLFRLHTMPWRYTGARMVIRITLACMIATCITVLCGQIFQWRILRSIMLMSGIFSIVLIVSARHAWRVFRRVILQNEEVSQKNVLIVGTGEPGMRAFQMCRDGEMPIKGVRHVPLAFVDDDLEVVFRNICGIPVEGGYADIPRIIAAKNIHEIILAVSGGVPVLLGQIVQLCMTGNNNIPIYIVAEKEGLGADQDANDRWRLRKLAVRDLLLDEIPPRDDETVRSMIEGRRVMVTGGAGSMGSELCQQIMRYNPEQLVILDVNENYLFQTFDEASSATRAKLAIVADSIVDQERMEIIFSRFQPQIVFHAAGYKNRLIAENCAESAVRNNVLGTDSVLGAAGRNHTELFVHLSSDQAKEVKTVLGMIKRIEEMSVQAQSTKTMRSISVRFGNILGAYGGVVSRLNTQIEHGGPVKIYDPDTQRSFISVKAAAFGMLKAASEAWEKKDEAFALFTLDMGWPIRIRSLAEMLIRLHGFEPGKDITIALPEGYVKTQNAPETAQLVMDEIPETVQRDRIVRVPFASIDTDLLRANVELMRLSLHKRSSEEICSMLREVIGKAPEEAVKAAPEASSEVSADPDISAVTANA